MCTALLVSFSTSKFSCAQETRLVFCADVEVILADARTTSAVQTLRVMRPLLLRALSASVPGAHPAKT